MIGLGDIAILKKDLKNKSVPSYAADELDRLCEATEVRLGDAVESMIERMLKEARRGPNRASIPAL